MSLVEIDYIGEGLSDEAIARKLIFAAGGIPGKSYRRPLSGNGKSSLDRRLSGLNAGVAFGNLVLALRDLDTDYPCAGALVSAILPRRHVRMLLRVCVPEAEAWLMADHVAFATDCGIGVGKIPHNPEALLDPKQTILSWVTTGQAKRLTRYVTSERQRGLADWQIFGAWHTRFAEDFWDPLRAANNGRAPSLSRALSRLQAACNCPPAHPGT